MSRRLRYSVAMSLDGFIADDEGGYAWIVEEDGIDFGAFMASIDTLVMGRLTYELVRADPENGGVMDGMTTWVVSTTLDPAEHPDVTIVSSDVEAKVAELKASEGKDIWLFGGGVLFRALLAAGLVDRVEVGVVPALLGSGVALLPGLDGVVELRLHSTEAFESGLLLLKYDVAGQE